MKEKSVGFLARLWMALLLPWRVLANPGLAADIQPLLLGGPLEPPAPEPPPEPAAEPEPKLPEPSGTDPTSALQLLGILQREGRFVDFLQQSITEFSDADIGAAARVVHAGCKRGLEAYVQVRAIRTESEGDAVVLEPGFDPTRASLTGTITGKPPFHGRLTHHGWEVAEITLPTPAAGHDPHIVAPAEIEL